MSVRCIFIRLMSIRVSSARIARCQHDVYTRYIYPHIIYPHAVCPLHNYPHDDSPRIVYSCSLCPDDTYRNDVSPLGVFSVKSLRMIYRRSLFRYAHVSPSRYGETIRMKVGTCILGDMSILSSRYPSASSF